VGKTALKTVIREKRQIRVRKKIRGTSTKPRLSVFRSARHIYAQIIDDTTRSTLVSYSTLTLDKLILKCSGNIDAASIVGKQIAALAVATGISSVVFDRNGFLYHGRIKALADAAREGGLIF
jgi:large subunit ribosomal protein L18